MFAQRFLGLCAFIDATGRRLVRPIFAIVVVIADTGHVDAFTRDAQVLIVGALPLLTRARRRTALFIGIVVTVVIAVTFPRLRHALMIRALPEASSTCRKCYNKYV